MARLSFKDILGNLIEGDWLAAKLFGQDSSGNSEAIKSTDNGLHTQSQAGSVWTYGNWPQFQTQTVPLTTNASASDNTVLDTLANATTFNFFNFECTAGTIDIQITLDGTNWLLAPVTTITAAGVVTANDTEIVATERAELNGKYKGVRVLQKGTTVSNFRGFYGNK